MYSVYTIMYKFAMYSLHVTSIEYPISNIGHMIKCLKVTH